ncbi:Fic family protein [Candidatus Protofrankia californiensis]|uniref:Fic family protein n=1 Tax=Candidatus Protofrankia californiensis TaxID=1839754 RepID=UPI001040F81C|nr:Fic family protein [Candidatus Protofrankia californiensis]
MRSFADLDQLLGRVPSRVVKHLGAIDRGVGSEQLFRTQMPGLLDQLADRARVLSVTASSAIEGVTVDSPERAERIIRGQVGGLRTRDERELAGYRDALDYVYREDFSPINTGLLLHVHRLLFRHTQGSGGVLKAQDNLVVDRAADGTVTPRFIPVSASETEHFLAELTSRYSIARKKNDHHSVLLVGLFALDLLVIHPFEDGNGRVARITSNALLLDGGYQMCRYVSLEKIIADNAEKYYSSLLASTRGWHDGQHDPWPWLEYFSATVATAYSIFADRAAAGRSGVSKQDRVRDHILWHAPRRFRLDDVRTALPGVSDQTIRIALNALRDEGHVISNGVGRAAFWTRLDRPEPPSKPEPPST